jgi:hypothetical protein
VVKVTDANGVSQTSSQTIVISTDNEQNAHARVFKGPETLQVCHLKIPKPSFFGKENQF